MALSLQLLEEAARRLQESIAFDRGDVAPHNALGDVLLARAERMAGVDPTAAAAAASAALQEGFMGALRINATSGEALAGVAEAHVQLARLAGGGAGAAGHWQEAAGAFAAALLQPEGLGGYQERCDVRCVRGACGLCDGDADGGDA